MRIISPEEADEAYRQTCPPPLVQQLREVFKEALPWIVVSQIATGIAVIIGLVVEWIIP